MLVYCVANVKGVKAMQEETYQLVMYMVYQAYREEIISKELFQEIDQYMCEKYNPIFPVSEKLWREYLCDER